MPHFLGGLLIALFASAAPYPAAADTWRGTAPFCKGRCLAGETVVQRSRSGNGGTCVTGTKVLCRNAQRLCRPTQTRTSCAGVVKICDNGYYSYPDSVWRSCAKYACGACVGVDF